MAEYCRKPSGNKGVNFLMRLLDKTSKKAGEVLTQKANEFVQTKMKEMSDQLEKAVNQVKSSVPIG